MSKIMDFKSELSKRMEYVEKIINEFLPKEVVGYKQSEIFEAMEYSVLAGGKR